jgi:thiol-disulfide isomerase/thioredoxin
VKTVASLGDKPLPIVSGEPGGSLRAESDEPDLPPARGSRISGRVYDERGRPVPNAKVRLAVGGAPGGRVIRATTDRSGAFTLRGLQSGMSYTLIAEYQDEAGGLTGRMQAKAPETDARITLVASDGESEPGYASIRPARPRVEPISSIDAAEDDESERGAGAGINSEDMDPPAPEAAALLPRLNPRASRRRESSEPATPRGGWNARQGGSKASAARSAEPPASDGESGSSARMPASGKSGADPDDDGPNPLPPAIERGAVSSAGSPSPRDADSPKLARSEARGRSKTLLEDAPDSAPRPMPADLARGDRVIMPGSYAPIIINDLAADRTSGSDGRRRASRSDPAGDAGDSSSPPVGDASHALDSSDAREPSAIRRPTWGELALKAGDVPVDESLRRASATSQPGEQRVVTLASTSRPGRSRLGWLLGDHRPPPAEPGPASPSECQIDPSERRIVKLTLPDLRGKGTSLSDFDADLILLDFWGSWCPPCRKSIPHLIDQQRELAGKRFQVIGIACERGATLADRRASAAKAVHDLGIDYPVLLSTMDGSCPVQQALQVQFYPTMILLDREGRILAREQGATDATLPRMDRAIAAALREDTARR